MNKSRNESFDEVYGARDAGNVLPKSRFPKDERDPRQYMRQCGTN
ncbi:hypothetical protein [Roseibium aggregatum]